MVIGPAVLRIEKLAKHFPGGGGVSGLDLAIERATSFGLLGPNGAGKSTTLKMLMGLVKPSSGSISVLGHDVLSEVETVRRKVGYVPEHQQMYPWMTVSQLIWFVRSFYPTWDDRLCADLLAEYGLSATKKVRELSNGMQTKLALVLALSHNPEFLVLDEPTTGLDPLVREEFLEKVHELVQTRKRTVLFSSHMMSDVEQIADTIGILNEGKILIVTSRIDLMEKTRRISAILPEGNGRRVAPRGTVYETLADGCWKLTVHGYSGGTVEELRANNGVRELSITKPSLEEILKDFIRGSRTL